MGTCSIGEMGVRGESGSEGFFIGDVGSILRAARAGEGGTDPASDSLLGFNKIPPLGAVSGDAKAGLGGMSSELKVGEMPSEAM